MEKMEVLKENALQAYRDANPEGKTLLATLFGKKNFLTSIFDRVQSFEAACEEVGLSPDDRQFTTGSLDDIAYQKLKLVIVPALNEGKKANYNDGNGKYWPVFYLDFPGFRFHDVYFDVAHTAVTGGSRLAFVSRDLAEHAAKYFEDVFRDFYC